MRCFFETYNIDLNCKNKFTNLNALSNQTQKPIAILNEQQTPIETYLN